MNKTIKKIIAREGLIFLGVLIIWFIASLFGFNSLQLAPLPPVYAGSSPFSILDNPAKCAEMPLCAFIALVEISIFPIYFLYLFIRFIIWAVRALREK